MKIKLRLFALFIILSLISKSLFSQEIDKSVFLIVHGVGNSPEEAKQKSLESALELVFRTFVSSNSEFIKKQFISNKLNLFENGYVDSCILLNSSKLPNSSYGILLKVSVSIDKLILLAKSNNLAIQNISSLFTFNIKKQYLNEQAEINAIIDMSGLLHESMQLSFDYTIQSNEPKSIDVDSKNWEIPLKVTSLANKNMDCCANYCISTLRWISLTSEEILMYENLNKNKVELEVRYNDSSYKFYLRKYFSKLAIFSCNDYSFFTSLFTVQSGLDQIFGNEKKTDDLYNASNTNADIVFYNNGQVICSFSWNDERNLSEIEKMSTYKVQPRGLVSKFKHGGFVVYEKDGHGMVAAVADLEEKMDWETAKNTCNDLMLNNYSDWRLPTKDDLNLLYLNLNQKFNIIRGDYISSSDGIDRGDEIVWVQNFSSDRDLAIQRKVLKTFEADIRLVRSF